MANNESISIVFAECLYSFGTLVVALGSKDCRVVHLDQVRPVAVFEEYGRFKIWGDQTKADLPARARGSLDDTLRRDIELQNVVHGALKRLRALLGQATNIASRKIDPAADSDHDSVSSVSADPDSDSGDEMDSHPRRMPLICLIIQQISGQIRSLFDLSSLLRRPNVTDKYIRSVQTNPSTSSSTEVLDFSRWDYQHILEKALHWRGFTKSNSPVEIDKETAAPVEANSAHPEIEDILWFCQRLAKANTRRREQLQYWIDHPYELKDSLRASQLAEPAVEGNQAQAPRSHTSTLKPPTQTTVHQGPKSNASKRSFSTVAVSDVLDTNTSSRPRTVYAASAKGQIQSNAVPDPPKRAEGQQTFPCPYCGMTLEWSEMQNRQSWKRHVFRDLRPYVCTFEDCQTAGKLYVSRHDWIYHEMQTHRREYVCRECGQVCPSRRDMSAHIHGHHGTSLTSSQLSVMLDLCSRQVNLSSSSTVPCLACGEELPLRDLQPHLAAHMESIALFVLPTETDEEEAYSNISVRMPRGAPQDEADGTKSAASSLGFSSGGEPMHTAAEFERMLSSVEASSKDPALPTTPLQGEPDGTQSTVLPEESGTASMVRLMLDAARDGDESTVRRMIVQGVNPDSTEEDSDGQTALLLAAWQGYESIVDILVDSSADVHCKHSNDQTPLHSASVKGHARIVLKLLQRGANPNLKDFEGRTPLHQASWRGHEEVVRILLDYRADPECMDDHGQTPLHEACSYGFEGIAATLLEAGAAVNCRDKDGWTPLHKACQHGNEIVVKRLLEAGADTECRDSSDRTPLQMACWGGQNAIVRELLEYGADPEGEDEGGRTPLHRASRQGHGMIIRRLLNSGASTERRDEDGWTALHEAIDGRHRGVAQMLLDRRACADSATTRGRTPLFMAAWNGREDLALVLLRCGAKINHQDRWGCTPLMWAARMGHYEMVRLLAERGAVVDTRSHEGHTAVYLAALMGHEKVARLLLDIDPAAGTRIWRVPGGGYTTSAP